MRQEPLARTALSDWLKSRKRERRHAEIAAFAKEHAGTDLDLDRDLEAAGIEVVASGPKVRSPGQAYS